MVTKRYTLSLVFIMIVYIFIFFTLNVARYGAFFSFAWEDEATENQLVWNTAHGNLFYQSIFDGHFFGHVTPFHFILSLGYRIIPHIFTWYFSSTLGLALSSLIIYKLADMIFDNRLKSFLMALIYLLYPPLHYVTLGPIDTITFLIPLFLLSFYFFKKDKFLYFMISAILAMSCKESVALIFIMFSGFAIICKKEKRWIITPLFLGFVWFIISTWFILPYLASVEFNLPPNSYLFYSLDKHTFLAIIKFIIFSPGKAFFFMFSKEHSLLLLRLFLPICFIPIFSITMFIGIPGFLQLLLVKGPLAYENSYYISNVIPFVFLGYIYGLNRLNIILTKFKMRYSVREKISYFFIVLSIFVCGFSIFGENIFGTVHDDYIYDTRFSEAKNIFDPVFYKMDEGDKIAWSMIKMIPKETSVSASGDLLIPLSHRKKLLEFGNREVGYDYFNADYIIINKKNMYHGAGQYSEVVEEDLARLDSLVSEGKFKIVSKKGAFVLLKNIK